ncbi:hypothetical protein [Amycolatopsis sp. NPDC059021]|uniref:hypothetical protein n=1 Tax=Amycolatopsis sp. NPDC059021 TaxID=3346704 RepID=UPI00366C7484
MSTIALITATTFRPLVKASGAGTASAILARATALPAVPTVAMPTENARNFVGGLSAA